MVPLPEVEPTNPESIICAHRSGAAARRIQSGEEQRLGLDESNAVYEDNFHVLTVSNKSVFISNRGGVATLVGITKFTSIRRQNRILYVLTARGRRQDAFTRAKSKDLAWMKAMSRLCFYNAAEILKMKSV